MQHCSLWLVIASTLICSGQNETNKRLLLGMKLLKEAIDNGQKVQEAYRGLETVWVFTTWKICTYNVLKLL